MLGASCLAGVSLLCGFPLLQVITCLFSLRMENDAQERKIKQKLLLFSLEDQPHDWLEVDRFKNTLVMDLIISHTWSLVFLLKAPQI